MLLGQFTTSTTENSEIDVQNQIKQLQEFEALLEKLPTRRENHRRDRDFIQFRTTFFNNYDFQVLRDTARQVKILERTGSRSTSWKPLLGVLPLQRNKELWLRQISQGRERFKKLQ